MYTPEQKERQRAVDNAVASQRLEGLEVDSETIADMRRIADGDATVNEVIDKIKKRVASGDFQDKPA